MLVSAWLMTAATIERIETNVERAAAAFFAGAVAFAVFAGLRAVLPPLQLGAGVGGAAIAAFLLCSRVMSAAAGGATSMPVPIFHVRELDPFELPELLLTEADRRDELLLTAADRVAEELLLTEADRVQPAEARAHKGDSRVVQLFDRKAMPTPGELQSRVDDHLAQASPRQPPSDASQALAAALAELRRSLR